MSAPAGGSAPSQDAIASLITQVSPTGQPARNAPRPARPRQGTKRTASTKAAPQATQPKSSIAAPLATDGSVNNASTETPIVIVQDESQQAPEQPPQVAQLSAEYATMSTNDTKGSLASTSETAMKPSAGADASAATVGIEGAQSAQSPGLANAPSSPRNAASTSQRPSGTKKRKSFWSSVFSCFSSSHEDDESNTTMTERNPGTANAMKKNVTLPSTKATQQASANNATQSQAKSGDAFGTTSTTASTAAQTNAQNIAITSSAANVLMVPVGTQAPSQPGTPLMSQHPSAPPSPKTDIAPEVIAANSKEGQVLSLEETEGVLSGAVQAPGSEGLTPTKKSSRRKSSGEASSQMPTSGTAGSDLVAAGDESRVSSVAGEEVVEDSDEEYMDEDERIIAAGGAGIPIDENGNPRPLLAELTPSDHGRKCLVLDLDETLLHSSFKQTHSPDFIVPVEIENQVHNVYVLKRPGVDDFMKRMGEIYEVVVFTASLSKYADPVLDHLDIHQVVKHRLFRESCYNHKGNYVKDLSQLGRPIGETIIIDNSPASYIFHPNNAVPVSSWFNDPHDTELTDLQHFLADLAEVPDVRGVLDAALFSHNDV